MRYLLILIAVVGCENPPRVTACELGKVAEVPCVVCRAPYAVAVDCNWDKAKGGE